MTPQTLTEVENVTNKNLLGRFGEAGIGACKRVVNDALEALPQKYPHSTQLRAFLLEQERLKRLLASLGE